MPVEGFAARAVYWQEKEVLVCQFRVAVLKDVAVEGVPDI